MEGGVVGFFCVYWGVLSEKVSARWGDLLGDGAFLFSSGRRLTVLSEECLLSVVATQGIAGGDGGWESLTVAFYHPLLLWL